MFYSNTVPVYIGGQNNQEVVWRTWTKSGKQLEYPVSVNPDPSAYRPLESACRGTFLQRSDHPDLPVFSSVTMMFLHFHT